MGHKNKGKNVLGDVVIEATKEEKNVAVETATEQKNVAVVTGVICTDVITEAKRDFLSVEALAKAVLAKYTNANITQNKRGRAVTETTIKNTIKGIMRIVGENRVYTGIKDRRFGELEYETKIENNVVLVKFITKQKDNVTKSLETGQVVE